MRRLLFSFPKLLSAFFLCFLFFVFPFSAHGQVCSETSPCATCCQNGPSCVFTDCPPGYQLRYPENEFNCTNTSSECQSQISIPSCSSNPGIYYFCDPVPTIPGTVPCPPDYPVCTRETGSICNQLGEPATCTISATETGTCCVWEDPSSDCGDHLQRCCGGTAGIGDTSCDPSSPTLYCNLLTAGDSACCYENDPECPTGIVVPFCPGICTAAECPDFSDLNSSIYYQCRSDKPFCCVGDNKIPIFCDLYGNPTTVYTDRLYTALGCLEHNAYGFVSKMASLLTGIAGGIGLILLIFSAFQMIAAGGDPKKVQAGKELLTSTLVGLSLIVLSVVILNFIGVNVLGLPRFGFNL
jgi:hypothetical protein